MSNSTTTKGLGTYADNLVTATNFQFTAPPTSIVIYADVLGQEEMLRISADGFWVRGQLVPQDQNEAAVVYNTIQKWATWHRLSQP
jgi:hypothetical protein